MARRRAKAIDVEGWAAWAVRLLVPAILAIAWNAYQSLQKLDTTVSGVAAQATLHSNQLNSVSAKLDQHSEKLAEVSTKVDAHGQQLTAIWQRLSEDRQSQKGKQP